MPITKHPITKQKTARHCRVEIGFDWKGNFLPSGLVRLPEIEGPKVESPHLLRATDPLETHQVSFFIYDITQRISEVLQQPTPQEPNGSPKVTPSSLSVTFVSARSNELISPFDPDHGLGNPMTATEFQEIPLEKHPKSCVFGNLDEGDKNLPGWIARFGPTGPETKVSDGPRPKNRGVQELTLKTRGVFLVNYTLVVGSGDGEKSFSTDPEWVVGGGDGPGACETNRSVMDPWRP